jgi:hypothetical protein
LPIDTSAPYSDGWWLQRLYNQLKLQQRRCQTLQARYEGNPPLPFIAPNMREVVRTFMEFSGTNFERLITDAVLSRLGIVGIRTAVDSDEGGDADAFRTWRKARGKLFTRDAHKMALAMSMSYVIVGKDPDTGQLLVTAEDPRLVTAITDPADPYKVLAAMKLFHDDVADEDVAYLYLPGRLMVAKHARKRRPGTTDVKFDPYAYTWDLDILNDVGELVYEGASGQIPWLQESDTLPAAVPVVPFVNEDGQAEFEPHLRLINRIAHQILQRMTIATLQAFKQRAIKGLPVTDPKTGEKINYDGIFEADPGTIWHIPETAQLWESGEVNMQGVLLGIRDDVKDLAATSGTPLYTVTPDAANGSAEGASLQRETITFKVEARQDRFEISHQRVAELMFRTVGDEDRSQPGSTEVIWAPAERFSMTERASAISQTRGVLSRYQQATKLMGLSPEEADRNASELVDDFLLDQQYGIAMRGVAGAGTTVTATNQQAVLTHQANAAARNPAVAALPAGMSGDGTTAGA